MFYYEFLNKCMDMNKIHAIEGDTDSLYFAVAGDPTKGIHQGFRYAVKNRGFYHKHYYEWLPNPWQGKENEKKLGGVAVENEGDFLIACAPKNYTIGVLEETEKAKKKMKGCSEKRNSHITAQSYMDNIENGTIINAENCGFLVKRGQTTKVSTSKVAITGIHTKMIVLENECCCPYIYGLTAEDYHCE
jgi:basic membrane lipoprotein Med (substrate-binding protein (PBP1-ABC) superfamily)